MADFFQWIADSIARLFDFISDFCTRILLMIRYLALSGELAFSIVEALPDWLAAFGMITVTVSIIYVILGRQTGGKKQ